MSLYVFILFPSIIFSSNTLGFLSSCHFFELSDWSDRRLGCRNWRCGKCVSSLHCFAMLPSLFTLSFVDKEDIEYG